MKDQLIPYIQFLQKLVSNQVLDVDSLDKPTDYTLKKVKSNQVSCQMGYGKPLTEKQMYDYELKPSSHNPDRAGRPSITAQLKEAAGRPEKSKEPEKQKHHKAHEGR